MIIGYSQKHHYPQFRGRGVVQIGTEKTLSFRRKFTFTFLPREHENLGWLGTLDNSGGGDNFGWQRRTHSFPKGNLQVNTHMTAWVRQDS